MKLKSPEVNGTVRTAISILVVGSFLIVWLYKVWNDQQINPVVFALVIAFAIAAGYGIWGEMFGQAVDEATGLTSAGDASDDDDGTDGQDADVSEEPVPEDYPE